jgi:hypothetical protein
VHCHPGIRDNHHSLALTQPDTLITLNHFGDSSDRLLGIA